MSDAPPGIGDDQRPPADAVVPGAQPPPAPHTDDMPDPFSQHGGAQDGSHYAQHYAQAGPTEKSTTLFVGQLPHDIANNTLERLFAQCGAVTNCAVIRDKESGRGKGFAFVTMATDEEAQAAEHTLDGFMLQGRRLRVAPKVCHLLSLLCSSCVWCSTALAPAYLVAGTSVAQCL